MKEESEKEERRKKFQKDIDEREHMRQVRLLSFRKNTSSLTLPLPTKSVSVSSGVLVLADARSKFMQLLRIFVVSKFPSLHDVILKHLHCL